MNKHIKAIAISLFIGFATLACGDSCNEGHEVRHGAWYVEMNTGDQYKWSGRYAPKNIDEGKKCVAPQPFPSMSTSKEGSIVVALIRVRGDVSTKFRVCKVEEMYPEGVDGDKGFVVNK